jgi:hypothetical protein
MLAPGDRVVALGEVDGMSHPHACGTYTLVSAIPEACRGAGRRAPAVGSAEPVSGSAQDANLLLAIPRSCLGAVSDAAEQCR